MSQEELRRFWGRLMADMEAGKTVSDVRADKALRLAPNWDT